MKHLRKFKLYENRMEIGNMIEDVASDLSDIFENLPNFYGITYEIEDDEYSFFIQIETVNTESYNKIKAFVDNIGEELNLEPETDMDQNLFIRQYINIKPENLDNFISKVDMFKQSNKYNL